MASFELVVQKMAVWIGEFLSKCLESWFTSILLFLMVLNLIVSVLIALRGGKK